MPEQRSSLFISNAVRLASAVTPPPPTFVGPGDVFAGALTWGGLRGYSTSYAAPGNNPCIDIVDSVGLNAATINILSNGSIDNTTLNAWIVAHGTASILKLYDQSGNGNHFSAILALAPTITQSVLGSQPAITYSGAQSLDCINNLSSSGPTSLSTIAMITGNTGVQQNIVFASLQLGFNNAGNNTWFIFGGGVISGAALNSAFHAAQAIFITSSTGNLYIDGTDNTGNPGGNAFGPGSPNLGSVSHSTQFMTGFMAESGIWASDMTGSRAAMNSNQHSYWGF